MAGRLHLFNTISNMVDARCVRDEEGAVQLARDNLFDTMIVSPRWVRYTRYSPRIALCASLLVMACSVPLGLGTPSPAVPCFHVGNPGQLGDLR